MGTILVGYDTETAAVGEALSLFTESANFPRYELALEEITGIGEALKLALASSERLLPALTRMLPASRPIGARPGLVVMDAESAPDPERATMLPVGAERSIPRASNSSRPSPVGGTMVTPG